MWRFVCVVLVVVLTGILAVAVLTVPADPVLWLTAVEAVCLAAVAAALLAAVILPRRRLRPVPARATGLTVLLALVGLSAALNGLVSNRPLAVTAGLLGASSVVVLRVRSR